MSATLTDREAVARTLHYVEAQWRRSSKGWTYLTEGARTVYLSQADAVLELLATAQEPSDAQPVAWAVQLDDGWIGPRLYRDEGSAHPITENATVVPLYAEPRTPSRDALADLRRFVETERNNARLAHQVANSDHFAHDYCRWVGMAEALTGVLTHPALLTSTAQAMDGYVPLDCPVCGRRRLELLGTHPIHIQCEKCGSDSLNGSLEASTQDEEW